MSNSSLYLWHIVGTPYMEKEGREARKEEMVGGRDEGGRERAKEGGREDGLIFGIFPCP